MVYRLHVTDGGELDRKVYLNSPTFARIALWAVEKAARGRPDVVVRLTEIED